jgi:hypothetical protein
MSTLLWIIILTAKVFDARKKGLSEYFNILIFEVFMKNGQGVTRYRDWLHFAYYNLKTEAAALLGIQVQPNPAKN